MAKVQIKSEKPALFCGIFMVMDPFFLCIAIGFFDSNVNEEETVGYETLPFDND